MDKQTKKTENGHGDLKTRTQEAKTPVVRLELRITPLMFQRITAKAKAARLTPARFAAIQLAEALHLDEKKAVCGTGSVGRPRKPLAAADSQ